MSDSALFAYRST